MREGKKENNGESGNVHRKDKENERERKNRENTK